jgi:DNA-binding MarR family transcriptional regulator
MGRTPAAASGRADGPAQERALLLSLLRLVDLTVRPFQEGLGRRFQLGLSEWRVLAVLHRQPGTAATELAQRTGLDKMSVSRALASLEAAGRVVRRADPDDGRRVLASLTTAGRQLHRSLAGPARARAQSVTAPLTALERRQLMAMLARMTESVRAADTAGPAARQR